MFSEAWGQAGHAKRGASGSSESTTYPDHQKNPDAMQPRLPADDDHFVAALSIFDQARATLLACALRPGSHSAVEALITEQTRQMAKAMYQAFLDRCHLQELAQQAAAPAGAARGVAVTRPLESSFGRVAATRLGFLGADEAGGLTMVFPLDTALNLPPEIYSLPVRKQIGQLIGHVSFEQALRQLPKQCGAHVPKRQAEQLAQRAARDFDAFYDQREVSANDTLSDQAIRVMSCDGKGIAVIRDALRPATRKAAEEQAEVVVKSDPMAAKKPRRKHTKRMALVSAVYEQEPFVQTAEQVLERIDRAPGQTPPARDAEEPEAKRPRPQNKTVSATLEKSQSGAIGSMLDEVAKRQKADPRPLVALVDGEEKQMRRLQYEAKKRRLEVTVVLDLLHVLHYLWTIALILCGRDQALSGARVQVYLRILLTQTPKHLVSMLRGQIGAASLTVQARKQATSALSYLDKNAPYLRYRDYLARGWPIATGVIEGACRHLVQDRMGITGARWGLLTAEAVLRLRALETNEDTDAYWTFHERQEFTRNHGKMAA
jgi:hypothetical protein